MMNSGCCEYCGTILDDLGFARRCYTPRCPNEIAPEEMELQEMRLDAEYERYCELVELEATAA